MANNISPLAHVDPAAKIGDGVTIHPFAYIDADVEIGDGCEIMSYTSIIRGTRMGRNNRVYQGSIIGADPQDFRWKGQPTHSVYLQAVIRSCCSACSISSLAWGWTIINFLSSFMLLKMGCATKK